MKIVAIDLGKSKSVACVLSGGEHRFVTVASRPQAVHDLLVSESPARVVIEVGTLAGWVCDLCRVLGVEVQVANPNHEAWRWKNVKHKSDRDDALKLARLSAMGQLPTAHVPEKAVRERRAFIEYRAGLVRRRTAVKNSIRAILTRQAVEWPTGSAGFSVGALRELRVMAEGQGLWRLMLREELALLEGVQAALTRAERELDALGAADPDVRLLRSIPGVGPRLAETIVAVIDDPHRFRNGRQVGSYAGLTPRRYQSGGMDRQGRTSGQGHQLLRNLLVEVAWLGPRWNPWMKAVYQRALRGSRSRKKIATVALARRLLVVCWAMLRDRTPWREPAALKLVA